VLKKHNASSQTVLCLHHDQWAKTRGPIRGRHGRSSPPRLAAQEQADAWLHQPIQLSCLVYHERFFYPDAAIDREKEIKGWRRSKKIKLIESTNPRWQDLAKDWGDEYKPEPAIANQREIPRPAGENAGLRDDASLN
jgi:hypothetical protein